MKGMKKVIIMASVVMLAFILVGKVYALGEGFNQGIFRQISGGQVNGNISSMGERVYGAISTVIKVVAVAGVMIAGVKYMTAGSGDKAAIKQSLIYIVIGTIFVFAADSIIKLVINSNII